MKRQEKNDLIWTDPLEEEIFAQRGLKSFDSFWELERSGADVEYKVLGDSKHKGKKKFFRNISVIRFEQNIKYYLKRASGHRLHLLLNEFEALKIIGNFGFKVPKLIGYAFDNTHKRGFLLTKNLAGFVALSDIFNAEYRPELIAEYKMKEEQIISNLAKSIISYQKSKYIYPELHARHIYVNPLSADVAMVDLESFKNIKDCAFYLKIPFMLPIVHALERKQLIVSMAKNPHSARALKRSFRKLK